MLEKGNEVCQPAAALYMRVAESCPFYWITWEELASDDEWADEIHLINNIPENGSRHETLEYFLPSSDGLSQSVLGRVSRKRKDKGRAAAKNPLIVAPGSSVVRDVSDDCDANPI